VQDDRDLYTPEELAAIYRHSPLGPTPPDPTNHVADNAQAASLGQYLFFDGRFSPNGKISCASCHQAALSFTDGRALAEGIAVGTRNSPTLLNAAFGQWYFLDGRSDSLWSQALQPFENPKEIGGDRRQIVEAVSHDPALRQAYERVFGPLSNQPVEGMIHMFRFKDNQVGYLSRWVQTERYKLQKKARRALFGRYRNRYTNDPRVAGAHMGTGNTTAMFHAGRLYALKEDDPPHRIDPDLLDTISRDDFDGAVRAQCLSAHPKVDPVTDELFTFSYQARGDATRDIVFYKFGPDRKLLTEIWFEMPYAACVHDFAITDEWIVFPTGQVCYSVERVYVRGRGTAHRRAGERRKRFHSGHVSRS
jgi:hypothetical protein